MGYIKYRTEKVWSWENFEVGDQYGPVVGEVSDFLIKRPSRTTRRARRCWAARCWTVTTPKHAGRSWRLRPRSRQVRRSV